MEINHLKELVARNEHFIDITALLCALADEIADVRTVIDGVDSLETRKALSTYLTELVAELQRIRHTIQVRPLGTSVEDDT